MLHICHVLLMHMYVVYILPSDLHDVIKLSSWPL